MHLTMLLDMAADGFGDRPVVGASADAITAQELRRRARTGAGVLLDAGADTLVYLATNGTAFPVAMFAAACAKVPLVPLNYRLGAAQLADLLRRHPRALVIAPDSVHDTVAAAGLERISPAEWLKLTGAESPRSVPDDDLDFDSGSDGPTAVVIYTSGTTSAPKGVLLRHHHLVSYVIGTVEYGSAADEEVALVCVPPYHIAAVANVITNLYAGRRTVVLDHFDAADWLATVRAEQVTNALVVPTMLARIIEHGGDHSAPALRTLAYGGAPMPARVIEAALRMWPDVGFVNAYGLTETSSTVAVLGPDDHRAALASTDPLVRARLCSTGRVIPTVDLRILDPDGNELPVGTVGRICVRGEQVSAEYDEIGSALDAEGFFDTRDEGYVDDEGFLFIGGRTDDTIIRGGENIAPAEIEAVLFDDASVSDVAVIGVPDDEWGQRIEAVVVPAAGASVDPEALRALVRARLRGSKTPDRVHVLPELPRTETGKLVRRQLRDLIAAGEAAAESGEPDPPALHLGQLLTGHPFAADEQIIASDTGSLTLGELRDWVDALAAALRAAEVGPGQAVGNLVTPGPSGVAVMFAVWAVGAVYTPVNARSAPDEVAALAEEAQLVLLLGTPSTLAAHPLSVGAVSYSAESGSPTVLRPARTTATVYPRDVAVISRTSGTTGKPKSVLLRHSGTIEAVDTSIAKLRGRGGAPGGSGGTAHRLNLIPVSLSLWSAIWNTLFSFRAGFGVVLLDRFDTAGFARAVREHEVKSTVLSPAMITMVTDDAAITDLSPLRLVRSITAPLSPEVARRFHEKFGAFVLNCYGQTELGGEVVGWTTRDVREFGEAKLGAVGRPYANIELRIQRDDGTDAETGERGEILVRSPFRMDGYADGEAADDDRFINGYLRTGDLGHLDADGFLWIEGRVSDMINRGGLKVFPEEVEEVLRHHPAVRDAGVAALPDHRLGEVPHAWIVSDSPVDPAVLAAWCREHLAPYKVPAGFTQIDALPRTDIGKLLRRELVANG